MLGSTELGLLGALEWERHDLDVEGGKSQCEMSKEEIDVVRKWMDARIAGLKEKRDATSCN